MWATMFGRSTTAWTIARTSGSEAGYGPAPSCSDSVAHSMGKFRFRSRLSSGGGVLIVTPSKARVVGMRLPGAVRVWDAHGEDAAVAVHVLLVQAVLGVEPRVRADARAQVARPLCQGELGAVGVQPGDD